METTNLSTLKIHKLSQAQYERELAAGNIDENAIYLTPEGSGFQDLGYFDSYSGIDDTILDEGKYRYTLHSDIVCYLIVIRPTDSTVTQLSWDSDNTIQGIMRREGYKIADGTWEFESWEQMIPDATVRYVSQDLTSAQKERARVNISAAPEFSTKPIAATSSDGITYTATVEGLTELYVGCSLMIVPNRESASTGGVTLNVNNLGAVGVRRWDNLNTSEWWGFSINAWMKAGYPVRLKYTGAYWIVEGMSKTYATDLQGVVQVDKGGTGVTSHADTTYTTARYRASALVSAETNPSTNGVINWTYE